MKKILLTMAAALISTANFAQDVKVTMADEAPFKFSSSESYVSIFLGDETRVQEGVADANYIYIGPDSDNGRNLWVWNDTYDFPTPSDLNSFGVSGDYMSLGVKAVGWSGLGYNIAATNPINLSFIDSNWSFHMAVKTQYTGPIMFELADGEGTEAYLVFGKDGDNYDGHAAIADFNRDGEWYNIDIPMGYLEDQFEFTFEGSTQYADKNYFVVCCGGVEGTIVDYDAVFFHGPKVDAGIIDGINNVQVSQKAEGPIYDLAGRRVERATKGIYIQNGKKFIIK